MTSAGSPGSPVDDPIENAVRTVAEGLRSDGWKIAPGVPGAPWRFVARSSKFRWRWMATRLHTFVFVMPLRGDETVQWLDNQLAAAVQYARVNKGGLPEGFQSGSATILVGLGSGLSPELQEWAVLTHGRQFAAVTHPVLADVATGNVTSPGRPTLGAVYHSHLHDVVARYVRPAVARDGAATGV